MQSVRGPCGSAGLRRPAAPARAGRGRMVQLSTHQGEKGEIGYDTANYDHPVRRPL